MLLDVPLGREGVWMWRFRWAAERGLGVRISGSALGTSRMGPRPVYRLCVERAEALLLCLMVWIRGILYL